MKICCCNNVALASPNVIFQDVQFATNERFFRGAFDFAREVREAPEFLQDLLMNHESLPWRRRAFERQALLDRLCEVGGFAKEGGAAEDEDSNNESEDLERLAEVPALAGELPDCVLPREALFEEVKGGDVRRLSSVTLRWWYLRWFAREYGFGKVQPSQNRV